MPSMPDTLQAVPTEAWNSVSWPLPEAEPNVELPTPKLFDEASFFASSPFFFTSAAPHERGLTSPPVSYSLRGDDLVTSVLLCCFIAMAFVFASSKKVISRRMKYFFMPKAENEKNSPAQTGIDKRNAWFLYLQWSLLMSLLFFDYTLSTRDMFMPPIAPHIMLAFYVLTCWAYLGIKQIMYTFINWIFFNKEKRAAWINSYSFLISAEGALLFPLALITVYFNAETQKMIVFSLSLIVFVRLLLAYKTICVFFPKFHCALHFITYLCALEILPLCALFKALDLLNNILL